MLSQLGSAQRALNMMPNIADWVAPFALKRSALFLDRCLHCLHCLMALVGPIVRTIPAQLPTYRTAMARGTEVDEPRSLIMSSRVDLSRN